MTEDDLSFLPLRVTRVGVGGKRSFDPIDKRRLVEACLRPGASLSGLALKAGVNANQLHKWVRVHEQGGAPVMPGLKAHDPKLWLNHPPLLTVDTADALMAAAQMNVVEFHTWNSTVRRIDKPDRVIFDLDPGEGVQWKQIQEAATLVRMLLTELELEAWLKTSGGKGLHVVVPLTPRLGYESVKSFSQAFVRHMAKTIPERFSAKSGAANRTGKIFVDCLRNGKAQTTATAFSVRARPGMGVSMPVSWEQLSELKSGAQWTVQTAREHLSFQTQDPWETYWSTGQSLASAIKRLE